MSEIRALVITTCDSVIGGYIGIGDYHYWADKRARNEPVQNHNGHTCHIRTVMVSTVPNIWMELP